jgi:hypothetical protein
MEGGLSDDGRSSMRPMLAVVRKKPSIKIVMTIAVLIVTTAGCGGGGSSSSSEGSTPDSGQTTTSGATSEDSNSEPSTEFVGKGENGKLATLGTVASVAEREAASEVLEENMSARAARDWTGQCASLSAAVINQIGKAGAALGGEVSCEKALEAQAEAATPSTLANTLTGPIDVLRVFGGSRGLAFYHGAQGKDYVIPLEKEDGEWKVAILVEEEIR